MLLSPIITIDKNDSNLKWFKQNKPYLLKTENNNVWLIADEAVLKSLNENKIKYNTLYKNDKEYYKEKRAVNDRDGFATYTQIVNKIDNIVTNNPLIATKEIIGYTEEGRIIWALVLNKNSNKPKYRIAGSIHGDELMPSFFIYNLIDYIFNNLTDSDISAIINNTEIWFIPVINVDGMENINRMNSNNVDLNRNFGFFFEDVSYAGRTSFSQAETKALRDNTLNENFVISFSFHTYGDYINYVWNFSPDDVSDLNEVVYISDIYENYTNYTVTEGFDWYQTTGDLNDYSYGTIGDLDWTIETDDYDNQNKTLFNNNKSALISILKTYNQGIEGFVYDENNQPLNASFKIKSTDSIFYNQPSGYFYRYLLPGNYQIEITAPNYKPQTVNVTVTSNQRYDFNVVFSEKESILNGFKIIKAERYFPSNSNYDNVLLPKNLLFTCDGKYFNMNKQGKVFIELPQRTSDYNLELTINNAANSKVSFKFYETIDGLGIAKSYSNSPISLESKYKYVEIIENVLNNSSFQAAQIDCLTLTKTGICSTNPCTEENKTICVETETGYECNCTAGYYLNETVCKKITFCNPENPCTEENKTVCSENETSFECLCDSGYYLSNNICTKITSCEPTNPCIEENKTICKETKSGFECVCDDGYYSKSNICTRLTPCEPNNCAEKEICNIIGETYECVCETGYEKKDGICTKIKVITQPGDGCNYSNNNNNNFLFILLAISAILTAKRRKI